MPKSENKSSIKELVWINNYKVINISYKLPQKMLEVIFSLEKIC